MALTEDATETVTIAAGVSYAVFQNTLNDSDDIVTARMQLDAFLADTGFSANYVTTEHPDPSRSGNWVFYFDASLGDVSDILLTGDSAFDGDAVLSSTNTDGALPGSDPDAEPGVNEVQSLANPNATAGNFTLSLTVNSVLYTTTLSFDADYQDIEDALTALLDATVKVTDTDLLYELASITDDNDNTLAFTTQNREIILDGISYPDLIGVSLVTAAARDLEVKSGYITEVIDDVDDRTDWHSLHAYGEVPMVYIAAGEVDPVYEEIKINFNQTAATELVLNSESYQGLTFVQGSAEADHFMVHAIAGQTFLNGGAGDDILTGRHQRPEHGVEQSHRRIM